MIDAQAYNHLRIYQQLVEDSDSNSPWSIPVNRNEDFSPLTDEQRRINAPFVLGMDLQTKEWSKPRHEKAILVATEAAKLIQMQITSLSPASRISSGTTMHLTTSSSTPTTANRCWKSRWACCAILIIAPQNVRDALLSSQIHSTDLILGRPLRMHLRGPLGTGKTYVVEAGGLPSLPGPVLL